MKFTVAASVVTSSLSAAAEFPSSRAGTVDLTHERLAALKNNQRDITTILKERRASKTQHGRISRNLQNKLKNQELRNKAEEVGDVFDADLDLGFFSRNLQDNMTEPEEANGIEDLMYLCTGENSVPGFSCSCSNFDVDAYTANVKCSYDSNCLEPTENGCRENTTFCFVETYEIELTAPGTGSTKICYDVNVPINFTYCYGFTYAMDTGIPLTCFLEVDGTQCNLCDFTYQGNQPNITCNQFDCTNIDETIGRGTVCGDDTIVAKKIEDYLLYGPLPCEGGCNICPGDGAMMNVYNNITLITGEQYTCSQLNLAALMGYLQDVPGDLCTALPSIVNEPCECTTSLSEEETSPPTVAIGSPTEELSEDIIENSMVDDVKTDGDLSEETEEEETVEESIGEETTESAATFLGLDKYVTTIVMASIISWAIV